MVMLFLMLIAMISTFIHTLEIQQALVISDGSLPEVKELVSLLKEFMLMDLKLVQCIILHKQ